MLQKNYMFLCSIKAQIALCQDISGSRGKSEPTDTKMFMLCVVLCAHCHCPGYAALCSLSAQTLLATARLVRSEKDSNNWIITLVTSFNNSTTCQEWEGF